MLTIDKMQDRAAEAAAFMKCFGSPHRLLILCQLVDGEKSVTALIEATGLAQTSVSQHLAKLKNEGLVAYRRDHRTLFYRISSPAVMEIMNSLYRTFCQEETT